MSGNKIGGKRAAATNKAKYGKDFYRNIGAKGGTKAPGAFRGNRELASRAGKIGGTISRRGPLSEKRKAELREIKEDKFLILQDMDSPIIDLSKPSLWNKLRRKV